MIGLSNDAKKFLEQLIQIRDYWLANGKSTEDVLDGFIFSLCAMFDGESGINDFNRVMLSNNYSNFKLNEKDWLHEHYYSVLKEMHNEKI